MRLIRFLLRRWGRPVLVGFLLAAFSGCLNQSPASKFQVTVPSFAYDAGIEADLGDNVGDAVAIALNHEVFKTLDMSIPYHVDGSPVTKQEKEDGKDNRCCLLYGAVSLFDPAPLPAQSHTAARDAAPKSQVIIWGKTWRYGPDVVAQPYLSISAPPRGMQTPSPGETLTTINGGYLPRMPFDDRGRWSIWQIDVDAETKVSITDFPGTDYTLSPIVFVGTSIEPFRTFEGLTVYDCAGANSVIVAEGATPCTATGQSTGPHLKGLQHLNGPCPPDADIPKSNRGSCGWSRIQSPPGWVALPALPDVADTVDFAAGLVHFMRGNWRRARKSFMEVLTNPKTPARIRRDAALLLTATLYRIAPQHPDLYKMLDVAEALEPDAVVTRQYRIMEALVKLVEHPNPAAITDLERRLDRFEAVSSQPRFVADVRTALERLEAQQR